MTEPAPPGSAPAEPAEDVDAPDAQYGALRTLLVGPERARIEALEDRLDDGETRADEVARVLPESLLRSADDPRTAQSLEPLIAEGFDRFIDAGQSRVVDALTPVMGALIRQWVSRELKVRLAELSRVLDQSLSPRSLAWRVEAWRTNKPYGEVVLLRTLKYRVVRVLLIHTETGILLRHVAEETPGGGAVDQNADVVSAMLTAVQSYMHDGFGADEGEAVDAIEIGDKTVWIENTPRAVLAVELAGLPDPQFRTAIGETMESIEQRCGRRMDEFEGDTDAFADVDPLLAALLDQSPSPAPVRLGPAVAVLIAAIALLVVWGVVSYQVEARFERFLGDLRAEPGIVLTAVDEEDGIRLIRGLRDPLAAAPDAVAARHEIDAWRGEFAPYHATHPPFVQQRAIRALTPPETAQITVRDGVLTVTGTAESAWWRPRRPLAAALPGVERIDDAGLRLIEAPDDPRARAELLLAPPATVALNLEGRTLVATGEAPADWIAGAKRRAKLVEGVDDIDLGAVVDTLDASTQRVESVEIEFAPDVAELTAAGEAQLARTLDDMARLRVARPWLRFVVVGHADATGSAQRNAELRAARADVVADALLGDPRLTGAVTRRAGDPRTSAGRVARIRVEMPSAE